MAQTFQVSTPQGQGFDVAAEQEEIARRRRLADMLRQQSAQPEGQMVSGRFVAPSITQRLAGLLNSYQSGQIDRQAGQQSRDLAERAQARRIGETSQIVAALTGGQRGVEGMPDETGNPTVQMQDVPGDPRRAALLAAGAESPEARAFLPSLMSSLVPKPTEWKVETRYNERTGQPEKVLYNPANPSQVLPFGGQQAVRLEFRNLGGTDQPFNPYTAEPVGSPIARSMTPGESNRLAFDQFTWNNPSTYQRASLENARIGNSIAAGNLANAQTNTFFNTGMVPMGGGAPRLNLPPPAPMPNIGGGAPTGAPQPLPIVPQPAPQAAPQTTPQGAPRPVPQVLPGQLPTPGVIGQPSAAAPSPAPGLTPKQQAEMAEKDAERRAAALRSAPATIAQIENTVGAIDSALSRATGFNTGLTGAVWGAIPGTSAYDLRNDVTTIKANLGFSELQKMREASPTGGALGSVAVQELEALQSTLRSLNPNQSTDTVLANLRKVRQHYTKWAETVAQANGLPLPESLRPLPDIAAPGRPARNPRSSGTWEIVR